MAEQNKSKEKRSSMIDVKVGGITIGKGRPLALICGPCVIESEETVLRTAEKIKTITSRLRIPWIFKSSYEKDNRGSAEGYRGPGLEDGLKILENNSRPKIFQNPKNFIIQPGLISKLKSVTKLVG